jgi:hypothetical protein
VVVGTLVVVAPVVGVVVGAAVVGADDTEAGGGLLATRTLPEWPDPNTQTTPPMTTDAPTSAAPYRLTIR